MLAGAQQTFALRVEQPDGSTARFRCKYLVMATVTPWPHKTRSLSVQKAENLLDHQGLSVSKVPEIRGSELITPYSEMSVDPADYVNKSVLIIGRGNAAFEAADNVSGVAAHTHMVGRSGQRFAWQTVRAKHLIVGDFARIDTVDLHIPRNCFAPFRPWKA